MNTTSTVSFVALLKSHVDAHQTGGHDWPTDATYAIEYRVKAWPTSWDRNTRFFANVDELQAWYASQLDWATLEDNYFEVDALWLWDLGPQQVADWAPHLSKTKHFHVSCSCGFVGKTQTDNDRGGWEVCPNCGML